ncbi:MAG: DUF1571 domain-containing protein [Planctomycetota bacterium]
MNQKPSADSRLVRRREFASLAGGFFAGAFLSTTASAQSPVAPQPWAQPVHRVANAAMRATPKTNPSPPGDANLLRGLQIARAALAQSKAEINDYTAVLAKRERVNGTLGVHEYMALKIRNRKIADGRIVQPFSVYIKFLKPDDVEGREVIYVENQNEGNLVAHEGGFKGKFLPTVTIPVNGMLAMRGQRYPLTEIGIENMIVKLIDRGQKAIQQPNVTAEFRQGARLKDRVCTVLQVNQPTRMPQLDFCQAQVFLDDQLNLPIRYIAHDWPAPGSPAGALGQVIEEYNYLNLQVNVGLGDADFSTENPAYNF